MIKYIRKLKTLYNIIFKYKISIRDRICLFVGKNKKRSLVRFIQNIRISCTGAKLSRCTFWIRGSNASISIGTGTVIKDTLFDLGPDCTLEIGENVTILEGMSFGIQEGSHVVIGSNVGIHARTMICALENTEIQIGNDCAISHDVCLRSSDSHSILDKEKYDKGIVERINKPQSIRVDDHVWIGEHVEVLKGVHVCSGSVIGARCLLTEGKYEGNSIYVGIPGKRIKSGIEWDGRRL